MQYESTLTVSNLCVQRGDIQLVNHVNFQLNATEVLHIIGQNGVGKSTLLAMLVGLIPIQTGVVTWQGFTPTQWSRLFISHHTAIDEDLTVQDNLAFLCHLQIQDYHNASLEKKPYNTDVITQLLTKLDLAWHAKEPAFRLSAGQKQRIQLAKLWLDWYFISTLPKTKQLSFAQQRLWVLDEPFTALDADLVKQTQALCHQFCQLGGRIIMTSHQPIEHIHTPVQILNLDGLAEAG